MAQPQPLPGNGQPRAPAILQEITQSLQLPWTPHSFIDLNDEVPGYVKHAWDQLSPIVRTAQFVDLAHEIESSVDTAVRGAYRPGYGPGSLQQLGLSLGEAGEIRTAFSALLFGWSQTILIVEALRLALDGQKVGMKSAVSWPREPVNWTQAIIPTTDTNAMGEVARNVLAEARQSLGLSEPPEALLVIGSWPRYLRMAWDDLTAIVNGPTFTALRGELMEQARQRCTRLPGHLDLSETQLRANNFNPIQIQRVREILDRWAFRLPTDMTLATAFRYALLENVSRTVF
ncbi:MAG TPA: hypothetical protein VFZ25_17690 [Chloroflexota bacterium]|nr:hypothetical protein [Chloroflexota bacterium]